jgi:chromosome segregation ATPase
VKRYRSEIEKMGGKDDGTAHTVLHAMVRVVGGTIPEVEPDAADAAAADLSSPLGQWGQIEKRIQDLVTERFEAVNATVERRLDGVDTRLGDVDKRLTEVETRLTTRLENIERLLNLIVLRETKS